MLPAHPQLPTIPPIYVRVSTQDQNLYQQEEELNRYCEVRNWSNVTIYRDKVSGTKSSREGLDDLMKAVRKHRHDVVLCYKIDRLGRSLSHLGQRNFFSVNWSSDIRRLGANCRTAC